MDYVDTHVRQVEERLKEIGEGMAPTAKGFIEQGNMVPIYILLDVDDGVEIGGLMGDAVQNRLAVVQTAILRHTKTVNGFVFMADVFLHSGKVEEDVPVRKTTQEALLVICVDRWGRMTTTEYVYTRSEDGSVTWEDPVQRFTPMSTDTVESPWVKFTFPVKETLS